MKDLIQNLKGKHIRVTPQRLGVYEILYNEKKHLTVNDIYARIKSRFPGISLATIYAILKLFSEKKVANEIRISFEKSCFEARTDSHHHFYCKKCLKILDIDLHPCPALQQESVNGHVIEKLQGYFYGICRNCKEKA